MRSRYVGIILLEKLYDLLTDKEMRTKKQLFKDVLALGHSKIKN